MRAGKMRHVVNVIRPTQALGDDGQPQGQDTVLFRDVPCSVETLSGVEAEVGGQLVARTAYRIEMYGDPNTPITQSDYLRLGSRTLGIASIEDRMQNGEQLILTCGERHDP